MIDTEWVRLLSGVAVAANLPQREYVSLSISVKPSDYFKTISQILESKIIAEVRKP